MLDSLPSALAHITEDELLQWVEASLTGNRGFFSRGYQGKVLLFERDNIRLIIKVPPRRGLFGGFYRAMMRHEYQVYQHLSPMPGIPACYGLVADRYLVLEYIESSSLRDRQPENRERFFTKLKQIIEALHGKGVAHVDLKKKDNILIAAGDTPYLVDFGVAVIGQSGFINRYLFVTGKRFDWNAWIKHKYRKHYDNVSAEDLPYLNRTWIEIIAHRVKYFYKYFKKCRWRKD